MKENILRIKHGIIQDVYDVHRHFRFANFHFDQYTSNQFRNDINKAKKKYPQQKLNDIVCNECWDEAFDFYPPYLIEDDLFAIFEYIFTVSMYVHNLRNTNDGNTKSQIKITAMVIPKSIVCIYDQQSRISHTVDAIVDYLRSKNIWEYQRIVLEENDQKKVLQILNFATLNQLTTLFVIIDRRHINLSKDILFVIPNVTINLKELYQNYFIGFDFDINTSIDTVSSHLIYALNQQLRFFPEMLTGIIPRIFVKPSRISEAEYLDKIYDHPYKHGWCVDLNDESFNGLYKIITGTTHISVNYNRLLIFDEHLAKKQIDDLLEEKDDDVNIYSLETDGWNCKHCTFLNQDMTSDECEMCHYTRYEEHEAKSVSINFGQSVLEWLDFAEEPAFKSLRHEIIHNQESTIDTQQYLEYAQECNIKMNNRHWEQYKLEELMSIKFYTDAGSFRSFFRRSFWKSSSKKVKKTFYHWAMTLYKTMLFHGKPTPRHNAKSKEPKSRHLYHGMCMIKF